jgi:hypothetical protein
MGFQAGRDGLLNGEIFYSLREAQILIEQWRRHYNTVRPHSALGNRPPAPESIIPMDQRPVMYQQFSWTTRWGLSTATGDPGQDERQGDPAKHRELRGPKGQRCILGISRQAGRSKTPFEEGGHGNGGSRPLSTPCLTKPPPHFPRPGVSARWPRCPPA